MTRKAFEQACCDRLSAMREAGSLITDDNGSPATPESMCWKDEQGNYGVKMLNAAWWGYRLALEHAAVFLEEDYLGLRVELTGDHFRKLGDDE